MKRRKPIKRSTTPILGKYQSREWRNLRARVLRRDKHWCQGCNDFPATQVHHISYGRGRHKASLIVSMEELVSLCQRCHAAIHPWMEEQ